MPLSLDGGADVALARNDATGRFDLVLDASGNPVFTDDEEHSVLSLLMEFEGGYWADITGKRGSRLYQIKQDKTSTPADIRAAILDALDPAIEDGRIHDVQINVVRLQPGTFKPSLTYRDRGGHVKNVDLPYGY